MSTALVPMADLERMAVSFAQSNFFGAKNKDQVISLLLLAQAEGVHPAIAMRDFDIIQGRPTKKAEAMHRSFLAAGGKIEWHALSDEIADATFSHDAGGTVRVTWDMARARKAGLGGKDMYSKYPRQMLKARVISEGCRTVYPAATSGMYVPDEVITFTKPAPKERDMGPAHVILEHDDSQDIPGVGLNASAAPPQQVSNPSPPSPAPAADAAAFISEDQVMELGKALSDCDDKAESEFLRIAKLERIDRLAAADYAEAMDWVERRRMKRKKTA